MNEDWNLEDLSEAEKRVRRWQKELMFIENGDIKYLMSEHVEGIILELQIEKKKLKEEKSE